MKKLAADSAPCGACGGRVLRTQGPGRQHEYRAGLLLPVPDDFWIDTCMTCGERFMTDERALTLEVLQAPHYAQFVQKLIASVCEKAAVSQRELELAMGHSLHYLKLELVPLHAVRFLQVLGRHPEEVSLLRAPISKLPSVP